MNEILATYVRLGCPVYEVSKTFTSGNLKGITVTEEGIVQMEVGKTYKSFGSGAYRVDACVRIA